MALAKYVINNITNKVVAAENVAAWVVHKTQSQTNSPSIRSRSNVAAEPFLNGGNSAYVESMYNAWILDPSSVHPSWNAFFRNATAGAEPGSAYQAPPDLLPSKKYSMSMPFLPVAGAALAGGGAGGGAAPSSKVIEDHLKVQGIIRAYQTRGHYTAKLDPLKIRAMPRTGSTGPDKLTYGTKGFESPAVMRTYGEFCDSDMDRVFKLPTSTFIGGAKQTEKELPLREIVSRLEAAYCTSIGVEYMYIPEVECLDFLRKRLEPPGIVEVPVSAKKKLLSRLVRTTTFENFLAKNWPSEKRFGLEGGEVMISIMKQIMDTGSALGIESIIIGMPHRGRLNVLANICRKELYQIFTQFTSLRPQEEGTGDIKYHLGCTVNRINRVTNKNLRVSVMANPSHLETVGPVSLGKTRAEQFYRGDINGNKTMCILLHGDAAFAGQGVVYEQMHLAELPDYQTHGTIHIVVNNQIGFTTDPRFSRSSVYCTDVGKVFNCPIFHVNGEDAEACSHVAKVATEWRQAYKRDSVIDIVCYRKYGHNEADNPIFTQPIMYHAIAKKKPVTNMYADQLVKEGVITDTMFKEIQTKYEKILSDAHEKAGQQKSILMKEWIDSPWSAYFEGRDQTLLCPTGIQEETLIHIGKCFASPPPNSEEFVVHPGLLSVLAERMQLIKKRLVNWPMAECMAFGSLMKEGIHVRLSGEDVERGTLAQRHHIIHHQDIDKTVYNPVANLYHDQAPYTVCNSALAEYSIMGFEHGYSLVNPNSLVMWEAQFGDFHNCAQPVIDTYLCGGDSKWIRQSGLVLLLPHGMEGNGPEHSSGRIERFVQLSVDDPDLIPPESPNYEVLQLKHTNWIICHLSTPANYFHVLRRQVALPFRKPLVLMTAKSFLRTPDSRSSLDDMIECTSFKRVIPDNGPASKKPDCVKKLVFCAGRVYYDLMKERKAKKLCSQIAVSRIEQFAPFPYDLVAKELKKYPKAQVVWLQEEHKNQGAWLWIQVRLHKLVKGKRPIIFHGRPTSSAPATGYLFMHAKERLDFLAQFSKLS